MEIKFLHFGVCFALCMVLEAKEIGQISRLIPLDDWIDFKNRTRDVKPLDKLIGKLRATYDFVFHKRENVSNVEKILENTNEESSKNVTRGNSNISMIQRRKSNRGELTSKEIDDKKENENYQKNIDDDLRKKKNFSNDRTDEEFFEDIEKIENPDDSFVLENLEIFDNENSPETFDEGNENSEKKHFPSHSNFAIPYAIAQAFVRWIVSLYLSTSNNFVNNDTRTREIIK